LLQSCYVTDFKGALVGFKAAFEAASLLLSTDYRLQNFLTASKQNKQTIFNVRVQDLKSKRLIRRPYGMTVLPS
jgi:hypothetical protein